MVVNIDASGAREERVISARSLHRAEPRRRPARAAQCLTIGLLNNMAGAAFKATERQFVSLLDAASNDIPIHVSFYRLPGMSLTEAGGQVFARHYENVETLLESRLDGLIVTGREPRMADLRDEPYWESFTRVLEWARTHTHSTVWSCLAAHAAILHMDGIDRRKSAEKNFGVFECAQMSDHRLTRGLPPRFHVPHSRWNGIAQQDLAGGGYTILSSADGGGVDIFVKETDSLFVFFQGHLEYESDTLMREYRRDVGRYIKGESATFPRLPHGYFDRGTEAALTELRQAAGSIRTTKLLAGIASATEKAAGSPNPWQASAARIYRNWLEYICERKSGSQAMGASIAE